MSGFITQQEFKEIRMPTDKCNKCGEKRELQFHNYEINIEGRKIKAEDLPQLVCKGCKYAVLTFKSRFIINSMFESCVESGKLGVNLKLRSLTKRFNFCEKFDFHYDFRDYENIPGLGEMTHDGFLTPVFFDKKSLIYFMYNPDYEFSLGSETYGSISYRGEFTISFGINENNRVIMWLGDLDKLTDEALQILKIHNVSSDHILMDTEFYDAQLNAIWSEPILEIQIVNLRNKFYDKLKTEFSLDLNQLDEEVVELISSIKKPLMYSEDEVKSTVSALHQILVEAVKIGELKTYYEANVEDSIKEKNYKEWKSIKYYEYLLSTLTDEQDIKTVIGPLYLLNDLRIMYSHLLPNEDIEKKKINIMKSLSLTEYNLEEVYKKVLIGLKYLFEVLNKGKDS
ncbi:hypothetical protein ACQVWG_26600 [Bacillus cereus]|uniref:hypothetical protein n=1 Tax=Bacillus cereus TaxID=1396 RepID=UPI003D6495B0